MAISDDMICALNGIKLHALSIENGKTSRKPTTPHKQYEIIFGNFFKANRAAHITVITNTPVKLIFKIVISILFI